MIPNDCLIVKPKKDVSPFTHLTWNSNGCPKTIPKHIYELNEYRLDVVEDPHYLVWPDPEKAAQKAAEKEKAAALKDKGTEKEDNKADNKEDNKEEKPPDKAPINLEEKAEEEKDIDTKEKGHGKGKNSKR